MNDRILAVRKALKITQQTMADSLGLKPNTISAYEHGDITPSDRTIADICRIYNVDEVWLRTGEGEMFRERSREEEIAAFVGELMSDRATDFQRDLVAALASLPSEHWAGLEALFREMLERQEKEKGPAEGQGQENE